MFESYAAKSLISHQFITNISNIHYIIQSPMPKPCPVWSIIKCNPHYHSRSGGFVDL